MKLFTPWKERIDHWRTASRSGLVLRVVVLAAAVLMAALGAWFLWAGVAGMIFAVAALVAAGVWAAAKPDGIGGLVAFVVYGMWWWFAGWDAPWWQAACCALVALVFHQACAWAAAAPLHADVAPTMRAWLGRASLGLAVSSALAMGLVVGMAMLPVPGAVVWSALALVGLVAVVVALVLARGDGTEQ